MNIQKVRLQNFRCFKDKVFTFDKRFIVIEGKNGSGKTSLLEALFYACYLRSFRTRSGRELVSFEDKHFFIQVQLDANSIQVGFTDNNKVVKLNKKSVGSYKELISHYRIIAAAEDDLNLIKGAPEGRRSFVDQALAIDQDDYVTRLRHYKQILSNRNSLLFKASRHGGAISSLDAWSKQLFETTGALQEKRENYLKRLEDKINSLIEKHFDGAYDFSISLVYKHKVKCVDFKSFWDGHNISDEIRQGRSLFGAHLDDFSINFRKRRAKLYASRGQQKLVVFLAKVAQFELLKESGGFACLLLDDFLTDLDEKIFGKCIEILSTLNCQVFITCPLSSYIISKNIPNFDPEIISI